MPDFDASPFLGSMPVGMFLDEFLEMGEGFPTAPPADFSMVPCDDVEEMSSRFVRGVCHFPLHAAMTEASLTGASCTSLVYLPSASAVRCTHDKKTGDGRAP